MARRIDVAAYLCGAPAIGVDVAPLPGLGPLSCAGGATAVWVHIAASLFSTEAAGIDSATYFRGTEAAELDLMRVLWLEGRVAAGLDRREEALQALEQVRRYFTGKQIAYDAALASLEVAVLDLEAGRTGEVKRLGEDMLWIFTAQGVNQEALAALKLFCEAARREEANAELAREVFERLKRARQNEGPGPA